MLFFLFIVIVGIVVLSVLAEVPFIVSGGIVVLSVLTEVPFIIIVGYVLSVLTMLLNTDVVLEM